MSVLRNLITNVQLRRKLLITLLFLVLYRLGSHVPISGVDLARVSSLFDQSGLLGFFNLFSGGALSRFSIFALGILPFINASIIVQLLTVIWPKLKDLSQEGDSGRKEIAKNTRYLAVVLSFFQAGVIATGFKEFLLPDVSLAMFMVYSMTTLVAGAALVMWIGELMTENGIGNGASLLIFIGIISEMPTYVKNTYLLVLGGTSLFSVGLLILVFIGMIVSIVIVQEAQRKVVVNYAKRLVGSSRSFQQSSYIPLRLIQGGVMPIIFASAVMQFPMMIMQYVSYDPITSVFNRYYQYDGFVYNAIYCVLIFFFTYFYTAITFNPEDLATNLQKQGGFISGVRPGRPTVEYLDRIISRLTFIGALFLSLVALVPIVTANATQVKSFMGLGGTALLIIVGVAMDLVRQIDGFVVNSQYERFTS